MNYDIPVYQPLLDGNEKKYVNKCLDSNWISSKGEFVNLFEDKFSEFISVKHSTSVCNGTVALHLALVTLGIGEGDEVIVPSFTYIASVSSISHSGATPIFADSLETTWQIDPEDIRRKITSKTKAIMCVHIYGYPCEMDEICKIAKENNIFIIEDCAEAFGTKYHDKHVGTFGDISTFSFYGNKTITTGEGGMVVTNDETLYDRAYHFKMHGLAKYREYWHDVLGFNYRMTNICAAIGLAQLERANEKVIKKREIVEKYISQLEELPLEYQRENKNLFSSYWMFTILTSNINERDGLREHLKNAKIETRPSFYPVHTMPMYALKYQKLPIAEKLGWCGINLPSYPELTDENINFISLEIKKFYKNNF
ncbi:MAG TPA: DegT/DnrJ/EryC1/StrS family aminotransferase [Ignavibacteria bacterium]|nr:DegT/DnrJ/EryC1/StrS family aminotransferase [Ignavibacteria bacterium]